MPTYISLVNWTEQGMQELKESPARADATAELAESMGGSLQLYWTAGLYDIVAIFEAPDDETAAAMQLTVGSRGAVRTTTLRAFGREEFERIIAKVPLTASSQAVALAHAGRLVRPAALSSSSRGPSLSREGSQRGCRVLAGADPRRPALARFARAPPGVAPTTAFACGCRESRAARDAAAVGSRQAWSACATAARAPPSGGRERMAVELEEVVGGGDQPPLGANSAASSASEAIQAAVELHLREDGLDHRLSLAVKRAAALAGQQVAHLLVAAAFPVASCRPAAAGVGRDEQRDAALGDALHLLAVPGARVSEHDVGRVRDAGRRGSRSVAWSIGSRCPKSAPTVSISAARTTCCSVVTAWALYPCRNPRSPLTTCETGSVTLIRPSGLAGGSNGFGGGRNAADLSSGPEPDRPRKRGWRALRSTLFFQSALGFANALGAAARHRLRIRRPLGLQALLCLAQPAASPLRGLELLGQLVPARVAEALILRRIGRLGFFEDLARGAARNRDSRPGPRWRGPWCRRRRSRRPGPGRCAHTRPAPRRTRRRGSARAMYGRAPAMSCPVGWQVRRSAVCRQIASGSRSDIAVIRLQPSRLVGGGRGDRPGCRGTPRRYPYHAASCRLRRDRRPGALGLNEATPPPKKGPPQPTASLLGSARGPPCAGARRTLLDRPSERRVPGRRSDDSSVFREAVRRRETAGRAVRSGGRRCERRRVPKSERARAKREKMGPPCPPRRSRARPPPKSVRQPKSVRHWL